jgi:ribosomal protein S21
MPRKRDTSWIQDYFFLIVPQPFEDELLCSIATLVSQELKSSSSKEEYFANIRKHWFYYENIAVEKIKNSAKKYGFKSSSKDPNSRGKTTG